MAHLVRVHLHTDKPLIIHLKNVKDAAKNTDTLSSSLLAFT